MSDLRKLPVLSLWRPWPALVFGCGKTVENRAWPTRYRGDLLVAAALRWDDQSLPYAADLAWMQARMGLPGINLDQVSARRDDHPTGIVGVVELSGVCSYAADNPGEGCDCPWWADFGHYHWQFTNPRLFPQPVPHRGYQRLWQVSDQVWPAVADQLQQVRR